jgi:hypothetical protein
MSERPIIFRQESVAAICYGPADCPAKRQTRRVIRNQPPQSWGGVRRYALAPHCPYGQPGDHLWVREPWWRHADGRIHMGEPNYGSNGWRKRSPMFMPRSASRVTLEIIRVGVERLQDISFEDCLAEGVIWTRHWHDVTCEELPQGAPEGEYARAAFRRMWDAVNAKRGYAWDSNPWVWAIEFRRLDHDPAFARVNSRLKSIQRTGDVYAGN